MAVHEADARERVDDEAQPGLAGKRLVPARGLVAVEGLDEGVALRPAQHLLHLGRACQRLCLVPLRRHARVHAQPPTFLVRQRLPEQPRQPAFALGIVQHIPEGVAAVRRAHALRYREQVQVVVAEQAGGAAFQRPQAPQHRQRCRPAVDEVAQQHEAVARGREAAGVEQPAQRLVAALHVPDEVVHAPILGPGDVTSTPVRPLACTSPTR